MKQSVVEIIIPTYKPDDRLRLLLAKLAVQTYSAICIRIINTGKKYWRPELIPNMGGISVSVTHIKKSEFDHGGTRALAASQSGAEFLLFMTQDALPADSVLVELLVKQLDDVADAAVAYARQIPQKGRGDLIENFTRSFNYPEESKVKSREDIKDMGVKAFFCSDVCAMYRKDIYDKVGGFVSPAIFNEDMIFAADAINMGYKIAYCAEAKVYHSHCYTGMQLIKRNFDIGVSQADYSERFKVASSEKEGICLVKKTAEYLLKKKRGYLIVKLFWISICKYVGYFLGKHYKYLPDRLISKLTSSPAYWHRK